MSIPIMDIIFNLKITLVINFKIIKTFILGKLDIFQLMNYIYQIRFN